MNQLSLGIMAHSSKTNERRLPIHPHHFSRIDEDLQQRIRLEHGYGDQFGVPDEQLAPFVAGFATREELIADSDVVLLPKPLAADVAQLREGQVLWGWPHLVQDRDLTQHAIDRRLTLIAFEAMNHWTEAGAFSLHVFHKNNELAGYSSVLHALQLVGSTGDYGRKLNAVVIGFGATARGAVTALNAQGIHDVDVLTGRDVAAVSAPIHSARILQVEHDTEDSRNSIVHEDDGPTPLAGFLAGHDLIVNCILQDPNAPVMFLVDSDLPALDPGTLIVDVSCDEGMGFSWARPTSFDDPMFEVGNHVRYYGVDHSPSYLWDSATWEISEALLPYLRTVLDGPTAWENDDVLRYAVEISDGVIRNKNILSFQDRSPEYPHLEA
ncbi:alanine dehydrogenase [Arthrobacter echini]|uniref:Alanine dehydrogenase n=2 Tax=Arthrobacter echini TaxID=1529066 RepID=A0A4S5E4S9_9MICC|nr:alanine dehydrogenase [Arthrobacter echini]